MAIANVADAVIRVALPVAVVSVTRSPLAVATVAILTGLPWLVFSLPAGALADRGSRRRLIVVAAWLRSAVLLIGGVAYLAGAPTLATVYVTALVLGMAETVGDTSCQSILPRLVPTECLERANSRIVGAEVVLNQFAGKPLGGLLAGTSLSAPFVAASLGYFMAGAAVLHVPEAHECTGEQKSAPMGESIRAGLRVLWSWQLLRQLAVVTGLIALAAEAAASVVVLYAFDVLDLNPFGYSLLLTAGAFGALLGAAVAPWLRARFSLQVLLPGFVAVLGLCIALRAITAQPAAFAVLVAGFSGAAVAWNIMTVSMRQQLVPDEMLGVVNAAYRMVALGTLPLGAALGGICAEAFGVPTVFWLFGAGILGLAVYVFALLRRSPTVPMTDLPELPPAAA